MQNQQPDVQMIIYRVDSVEKKIKDVQDQLKSYVSVKENELQLQNIQSTVSRIERDVVDIRTRLEMIKEKIETQERESRKRDEAQTESQAKLQIRLLYGIVAFVLTVVSGFLVAYFNHFFH